MIIKGNVHCLFEQSGTFKNEFKKLGYNAYDYDIQNNFGQTDYVIDLFNEIEKAWGGVESIFDNITQDDLIMAFFPCVYFETMQMIYYQLSSLNNRHKTMCGKITDAIERLANRTLFHTLLYKLFYIAYDRGFRLILENPATQPNYLVGQKNFPNPTLVDNNRMLRGDYFRKPTAYWFVNCSQTFGKSYQNDKEQKKIKQCKSGVKAGICSEERSMISPDYARNFICDFIIGKEQDFSEKDLFGGL